MSCLYSNGLKNVMDLRLRIGCVLVLAFSAVRACQLNDHPSLTNASQRLVNHIAVEGFLNDFHLNTGWYRTSSNGTLYTMADMSQNVTYTSCGTFKPIYLKDTHPNLSSIHVEYTDVEACVYDDKEECNVAYTLRIRRCGLELEYYLHSTLPYAAYCLVPQCPQGFYGPGCQHVCQCKAPGTQFCYPDTGECECHIGFRGPLCEHDVDECLVGLHNCSLDTVCYNTEGSYRCVCRDGLTFDDSTDMCIPPECSNGTYKIGCYLRCHCNTEHSVQYKNNQWCNPVSGQCICKDGWTGFTCDADIDECKINGDCEEAHSVCKNSPGTFSCECTEGYSMVSAKCTTVPGTENNYTYVIISVSVALVSILVIALVALWKCKGWTCGIKPTHFRIAPYTCTGTSESSIDLHSNYHSCIDETDNRPTEAEHVYERYSQPPVNNRMNPSNDIFIVRGDNCAPTSVHSSGDQPQYPDEHVYLSLQ